MPNQNYLRGVRFEREVMKIFKDAGFIVMRTAGSHSPFDVVLVKESKELKKIAHVAFVQCKTEKNKDGK